MHENFHRTLIFHLSALSLAVAPALPASAQTPADEYTRIIQPIFDGRCISCHSCNNAPCQLNLQSGTGVSRGATSRNVYDRFRPHSVAPTRLDIDASTVPQWRAKGFFDVTSAGDPARALLLKLVEQRINAGQVPGLVYETPNSGDIELVEVNRT